MYAPLMRKLSVMLTVTPPPPQLLYENIGFLTKQCRISYFHIESLS